MNYGFIGAGNMAYSFIKGLLENNAATVNDIGVYDKNLMRQDEVCRNLNINAFLSPQELISKCDMVYLVVKPHQIKNLLEDIADSVKQYAPLIVSIAAGKSVEYISSFLSSGIRIVRIMPNVNSEVMQSVTAYCCNEYVTDYDRLEILKCLTAIGSAEELDEELFPVFTAIAGCAPAFVYLFAESMATAAVKLGMNKKQAYDIAAQTVFGSAEMMKKSPLHPWQLIDKVSSPGGATIDGVCSLQENRFESTVVSAVETAYNKSKGL